MKRRRCLSLFATLVILLALDLGGASAADHRPIVFVHGNGDSAAIWSTTIWRFESNGWSRSRLVAVDFTHPTARRDDAKPEDNRSSSSDQLRELTATVAEVQRRTGGERVILVGSSRGGYVIRNYVKHGGAANVSEVILAGVANHGIWSSETHLPGSEFNARSPFLVMLNSGDEVHPGSRFLTLRSDGNDKYAQPDGRFIGRPGQPTNVTAASPELRGATNVVLPGLDHRELAFHERAFVAMHRFITGRDPEVTGIAPEATPLLDGVVSGFAAGAPTNLPVVGAAVEVYEVDADSGRRIALVHRRAVGSDGHWGPFTAKAGAFYEFVVAAEGYPTTHVYRTPFPRSSAYVHFRLRPLTDAEKSGAGALVRLSRPRGYLGHGRDTFLIQDTVPDGVVAGVPANDSAIARLPFDPEAAVRVVLNSERLTVRTYPLADSHVVIAEFTY